MDLLDIATIRDVRTGIYAKKPRVSDWVLWEEIKCGLELAVNCQLILKLFYNKFFSKMWQF